MTRTQDIQEMPGWVISSVPGVRLLLDLLFFAAGVLQHFWQYLNESLSGVKRTYSLTSTIYPTYSSLDGIHSQEMSDAHTLVDIKPIPISEKPPNISFLSYAPSVWTMDNRILGQLKQLEQAQSYLFRSINILIDSQEGLDDVEEFVEALSWESDLSDISRPKPPTTLG